MSQEVYNKLYGSYRYTPRNGDLNWMAIRRKFWSRAMRIPHAILDVGCGRGIGLAQTAREFKPRLVVGVDISLQGIILNRERRGNSRARFVVADATHLPFKPGVFDFVFTSDMLEHLEESNVMRALNELRRVGRDFWFIVACITEELSKFPEVGPLHLTIKDGKWWMERFHSVGLHLKSMWTRGSVVVGIGPIEEGKNA